MTRLEAALADISTFLDEHHLAYMVIGGFANLYWGVERFTRDLDLTVEIPEESLATTVGLLRERFTFTTPDPLEFARLNHLVRLRTSAGVDVDLILAALPYESRAIRRAVVAEMGGRKIRLCSPEDLVLHKLASERPQDAIDVEGIIVRQIVRLDRGYLDPLVKDLAAGLERPSIVEFYLSSLARAGRRENER